MQITLDGNYLEVVVERQGEMTEFDTLRVGSVFGKFGAVCNSVSRGPARSREPDEDEDPDRNIVRHRYGGPIRGGL